MALPIQILLLTRSGGPPIRLVNPVMIAQEAISHLGRCFRQMRGPSNSCILNLPMEIILMIATHLDGCSLVSLALTCKSLHSLWEPRSLPLHAVEKENLLVLLEKDNPFFYYCHYCVKLHRWHGRWSRSIPEWYEETLPCKRRSDKHLQLPPYYYIPYFHARLVMNRHLYGPKHGLPLQVLNERSQSLHHLDGVESSISQHARILNDQLLVISAISMKHARGDSGSLRSRIDEYASSVCEHLTLKKGYHAFIPTQLPELAKQNTPSQFVACGPSFGSCTFCPTDYSIEILWQGARKGYNIEVLIYRRLGDCRTPFNWHWHTITTRHTDEELRSAYLPDLRPGSIREQWNEASDIA